MNAEQFRALVDQEVEQRRMTQRAIFTSIILGGAIIAVLVATFTS